MLQKKTALFTFKNHPRFQSREAFERDTLAFLEFTERVKPTRALRRDEASAYLGRKLEMEE